MPRRSRSTIRPIASPRPRRRPPRKRQRLKIKPAHSQFIIAGISFRRFSARKPKLLARSNKTWTLCSVKLIGAADVVVFAAHHLAGPMNRADLLLRLLD